MERQEIYCHGCGNYVQFDIDIEMNGNHVLKCPNCGHEHCRVVKDGVITSDRWDSRNPTYQVTSNVTYTTSSTWGSYNGTTTTVTGGTGDIFLYSSWLNLSSAQGNQTTGVSNISIGNSGVISGGTTNGSQS